jgi:hypothetical protein
MLLLVFFFVSLSTGGTGGLASSHVDHRHWVGTKLCSFCFIFTLVNHSFFALANQTLTHSSFVSYLLFLGVRAGERSFNEHV